MTSSRPSCSSSCRTSRSRSPSWARSPLSGGQAARPGRPVQAAGRGGDDRVGAGAAGARRRGRSRGDTRRGTQGARGPAARARARGPGRGVTMAADAVGAPADEMVGRLGDLAGALRAQGTRVGVGELLTAVRSLRVVDPAAREDARLALRTVLCSQKVDLERFDAAFLAVFGDGRVPSALDDPLGELGTIERAVLPRAGMGDPEAGAPREGAEPLPVAWSDIELLVTKDFARFTEDESARARELIARLARRHPTRLSRRTRPSRRRDS